MIEPLDFLRRRRTSRQPPQEITLDFQALTLGLVAAAEPARPRRRPCVGGVRLVIEYAPGLYLLEPASLAEYLRRVEEVLAPASPEAWAQQVADDFATVVRPRSVRVELSLPPTAPGSGGAFQKVVALRQGPLRQGP